MPTCWIIAGPNGAGKTTFALDYLPALALCRRFINADLIAAGLSPLAPEQQLLTASRWFLREIEDCIAARQDFAFETTLSGRTYLRLLQRLRAQGWRIELIYLGCRVPKCHACAWLSASLTAGTTFLRSKLRGAFHAACTTFFSFSRRKSVRHDAS